jgi:hypothetical protein
MFPDIRSSASVNRTICALVINSDVVVASSDPEEELPSTPVFAPNDVQDDGLPNSSPIVASVSRKRSDSRRAGSLSAKKPLPEPEPLRDFPSSPPDVPRKETMHTVNSHMTEDSDVCLITDPTQLQCSEETGMRRDKLAQSTHTVFATPMVEDESTAILDGDLPQQDPYHDEGYMDILDAKLDGPGSSDPLLPAAQLAAEMQANFAEQTQERNILEDNGLANTNPLEASSLGSPSVSAQEVSISINAPLTALPPAVINSLQPVISSTEQSPITAKMDIGELKASPSPVSQTAKVPVPVYVTRQFSAPPTRDSKRLNSSILSVNSQPNTHKSQELVQSFPSPSRGYQSNPAMGKRRRKSPALSAPSKRTKTTEWYPKPPRHTARHSSPTESDFINVLSTEERKRSSKTSRIAPVIKTSPVPDSLVNTRNSQTRPSSRLRSCHPLSSAKDLPLPKISRGSPIDYTTRTPDLIVVGQHSQPRRSNRLSDCHAEHSVEDLPPRSRRRRQSVQQDDGPQNAVEAVSSKKRKGEDGKALMAEDSSHRPSMKVVIPFQPSESPIQHDKPESSSTVRKILSPKSIMAKLRALIVEAGEVVFGKDEQAEFAEAAFELAAAARGYKIG